MKSETPKSVNVITINCDASYHPKHKTAGYAFYIVCDLFKVHHSGMFKKQHPDSANEAEMMCMGNAIAALLTMKELPTAKWIILNGDCQRAFKCILSKQGALGNKINKLWKDLIVKTKCQKHAMRYVKAHNGSPDKRSAANEWCDREAKKWMRLSIPKSI